MHKIYILQKEKSVEVFHYVGSWNFQITLWSSETLLLENKSAKAIFPRELVFLPWIIEQAVSSPDFSDCIQISN